MIQYFFIILGILNSLECSNSSDAGESILSKKVYLRQNETETPAAPTEPTEPTAPPEPTTPPEKPTPPAKPAPPPPPPPPTSDTDTTDFITEAPTTIVTTTLTPVHKYGWYVWCKLQTINYDCDGRGALQSRFSFDVKLGSCVRSLVSSCANNLNQFKDSKACNNQCRQYGFKELLTENPEIYCRLQPEFGDCQNYVPSFYYDVNERACKGFSYSGCGGNSNRFENMHYCTIKCGKIVRYTSN